MNEKYEPLAQIKRTEAQTSMTSASGGEFREIIRERASKIFAQVVLVRFARMCSFFPGEIQHESVRSDATAIGSAF